MDGLLLLIIYRGAKRLQMIYLLWDNSSMPLGSEWMSGRSDFGSWELCIHEYILIGPTNRMPFWMEINKMRKIKIYQLWPADSILYTNSISNATPNIFKLTNIDQHWVFSHMRRRPLRPKKFLKYLNIYPTPLYYEAIEDGTNGQRQ